MHDGQRNSCVMSFKYLCYGRRRLSPRSTALLYACIYFLLLLVNKARAVKHYNTVAHISQDIFVIKIPCAVMARRPKITLVL
jgi:hypothetical protein